MIELKGVLLALSKKALLAAAERVMACGDIFGDVLLDDWFRADKRPHKLLQVLDHDDGLW